VPIINEVLLPLLEGDGRGGVGKLHGLCIIDEKFYAVMAARAASIEININIALLNLAIL
jgi:hypothetical protein